MVKLGELLFSATVFASALSGVYSKSPLESDRPSLDTQITRAMLASSGAISKMTSIDGSVRLASENKAKEVAGVLQSAAEAANVASKAIKVASQTSDSPISLEHAESVSTRLSDTAGAMNKVAVDIYRDAEKKEEISKLNQKMEDARVVAHKLHRQNVAAFRSVDKNGESEKVFGVRDGLNRMATRALNDADLAVKSFSEEANVNSPRPIVSAAHAHRLSHVLDRAGESAASTSDVLDNIAVSRELAVGDRPASSNAHIGALNLGAAARHVRSMASNLHQTSKKLKAKFDRGLAQMASFHAHRAAVDLRKHLSHAVGAATDIADDIESDKQGESAQRVASDLSSNNSLQLSLMDSEDQELRRHSVELKTRIESCVGRSNQLVQWNQHWQAVARAEMQRIDRYQNHLEQFHVSLVGQQKRIVDRANVWAARSRLVKIGNSDATPEKLQLQLLGKYAALDKHTVALVRKSKDLADLLSTSEVRRKDLVHFRRIGYALAAVCIIEVLLFAALGAYCIGRSSTNSWSHAPASAKDVVEKPDLPTSSGVVELQDGEIKINNPNEEQNL